MHQTISQTYLNMSPLEILNSIIMGEPVVTQTPDGTVQYKWTAPDAAFPCTITDRTFYHGKPIFSGQELDALSVGKPYATDNARQHSVNIIRGNNLCRIQS